MTFVLVLCKREVTQEIESPVSEYYICISWKESKYHFGTRHCSVHYDIHLIEMNMVNRTDVKLMPFLSNIDTRG